MNLCPIMGTDTNKKWDILIIIYWNHRNIINHIGFRVIKSFYSEFLTCVETNQLKSISSIFWFFFWIVRYFHRALSTIQLNFTPANAMTQNKERKRIQIITNFFIFLFILKFVYSHNRHSLKPIKCASVRVRKSYTIQSPESQDSPTTGATLYFLFFLWCIYI